MNENLVGMTCRYPYPDADADADTDTDADTINPTNPNRECFFPQHPTFL